jgi:hypothetical protein
MSSRDLTTTVVIGLATSVIVAIVVEALRARRAR